MRELSLTVGGFSRFAEKVGVSESQVSELLGKNPIRNIGVKTARRIEEAFEKPLGWIDQLHEENAAAVMLSSSDLAETELRILRDQVGKAVRACVHSKPRTRQIKRTL